MLELLSSPPFSPGSRVERSFNFRMTSSSMLELLSSPPFSPGSRMEICRNFRMMSSPMLELLSSPPGRGMERSGSSR
jgi:hypothetical protein